VVEVAGRRLVELEVGRGLGIGYDIVRAQADSGSVWLRAARRDMVEEKDSLRRRSMPVDSAGPGSAPADSVGSDT